MKLKCSNPCCNSLIEKEFVHVVGRYFCKSECSEAYILQVARFAMTLQPMEDQPPLNYKPQRWWKNWKQTKLAFFFSLLDNLNVERRKGMNNKIQSSCFLNRLTGGDKQELFCSRVYRNSHQSRRWKKLRKCLDKLFSFKHKEHCRECFLYQKRYRSQVKTWLLFFHKGYYWCSNQ